MMLNQHKSTSLVVKIFTRIAIFFCLLCPTTVLAQDFVVPNYFDAKERIPIANVTGLERVRFLTTVDFPPFSFLDDNGRLTGFHVDLAREICTSLKILERCQIQAVEWSELTTALENGAGEAIIAGLSISERAREQYLFSRTYLELPARFLVLKDSKLKPIDLTRIRYLNIGVLKGTAHEAMFRSWFPELGVKQYEKREELITALKTKKIGAMFGDSLQLSFWLMGDEAKDCCQFMGGPYLSREYLGEGLAIAVAKDNTQLVNALNFGLAQLSKNGRFKDVYLRYFPNSIY